MVLSRALRAVELLAQQGETSAEALRDAMFAVFADCDTSDLLVRLEYAAVVDPDTLLPVADMSSGALVAVAAWVGNTRLIDNILIGPAASPSQTPSARGV